jgi:hypothetical protein
VPVDSPRETPSGRDTEDGDRGDREDPEFEDERLEGREDDD